MSRSAYASKFRVTLGEAPLSYLRRLRIQRGMKLLRDQRTSLGPVTQSVGYGNAFAFSKVFKKVTAQGSKEFRKSMSLLQLDAVVPLQGR